MMKQHCFKPTLSALILAAACLAATAAGAPQVAGTAQVGEPASPGTRFVFLYLQYQDGAQPHAAYSVYHKPGLADAPGNYQQLAVIRPTLDIAEIAALMELAAQAGFDNGALESLLDEMLPAAQGLELAEKISLFFQAELPGGFDEQQRQAMLRTHPQMALVRGQAFLGRAPDSGPNTFEMRVFDPLTEEEGPVAARMTSPAAPVFLPQPDGLSERVETRPRGHLRTNLRWCLPQPLHQMAFHWNGFNVYRVARQGWMDAFGVEPPLDMTRAALLDALDQGQAVQVNRLPITPGEDLPCPPPTGSEAIFLTDDNDSVQQQAFAPGGTEFPDGFEATYFAAARDHFGRPGHPSPGLEVRICDRLPPSTPSRVRVDNIYRQEGATDHALRISWQRDNAEEVGRYHIFRYADPNGVFDDRLSPVWPATGNRIAVVNNSGSSDRLSFTDTGLTLPAADGRTHWWVLVGEDNTSCPNTAGLGNLSGPSGPVPGAVYNLNGPDAPEGRLRVPCCRIEVAQEPPGNTGPEFLRLAATRQHTRLAWVEFRESQSETFLGRFSFGTNMQVLATPEFGPPSPPLVQFEARFGTAFGLTSDWVAGFPFTSGPYPEQRWTGSWACTSSPGGCPGGVIDPVDPETDGLTGVCVEFDNSAANAVQASLFRRLGDDAPLVLMRRERLDSDGDGNNDVDELCEIAPPANPGLPCYFLQFFDRNGNPSVVSRSGCTRTRGTEGFPVPRITHFFPNPFNPPDGATLAWFCPRPGVDRFEIGLKPPPPDVPLVEGWGILESDRIAAGFGDDSPNFAVGLTLVEDTVARVRAVGPGPYGERYGGDWSDPAEIAWLSADSEPPADCPVPWPARDIAPLITEPDRELDAQLVGHSAIPGMFPEWRDVIPGIGLRPATEIWIRVGTFEPGEVISGSTPASTISPPPPSSPPRIIGDDLSDNLLVPLPFTVYLHQTSPGSRGTMLQVSHYVDQILTEVPQPGQLAIIDRAFAVTGVDAAGNITNAGLWFRVRHPLIAGRSYRCAVVVHGGNREPIETLRTVEIVVPQ